MTHIKLFFRTRSKLFVSLLLGILTGMYMDGIFNTYPVFIISFTFLGIVTGYRITGRNM